MEAPGVLDTNPIRRCAVSIREDRSVAPLSGARIAPRSDSVRAFAAVSLLFGTLIILATPPLRGPDETAHFLRAYGVALGDIVPSSRDAEGRKGIFLPAHLYEGFEYFESVRVREKEAGFNYKPVFRAYFNRQPFAMSSDRRPTFVPYGGSEGYSPVAYLPHIAAALLARAVHLDFVATFYLMRFAGLAAMTALIAFAIATVPQLAWPVLAVAMLPAAVYGRSVINADGSALATALMATALWLRGMLFPQLSLQARLSFWLTLGALTKPTNLVFVLLGLMTSPDLRAKRCRRILATILPAVAVALLWSLRSGADVAAWRMVEITRQDAVAFDPAEKISYLLSQPLHFPAAVLASLHEKDLAELWRQTIGVLGLFDTVLQPWVYPAVTALLLGTLFMRLPIAAAARREVAVIAGATAFAYVVAVYFVCYLVFTPLDADMVWGMQGRYFVPILALVAIVFAALVDRAPDERLSAAMAISAAVLSGSASVEAILRVDWDWSASTN
jgi:uncharacterized membrane protein